MKSLIIKILYIISKYFGLIRIEIILSKIALNKFYQSTKFSHPKNLIKKGFKVFSQQDEDGILEEIFKRINIKNKKFVEIGVETGIECNTTYLLYKNWKGLWIEGDINFKKKIDQNFEKYLNNNLIVEFSKVNPENINEILINHLKKNEEIDLLSIDIGTHTFHTLKNLTIINPRVIVVEYNPKYGPTLEWEMEYDKNSSWDGSDYYGASLKSYQKMLEKINYKLVGCNITGVNAFFVRGDLVNDKFINDYSSQYHFCEENIWLKSAFKNKYKIRIK